VADAVRTAPPAGGSPEPGVPSRLDAALVARGLARSRGQAADLIRAGRVRVDGRPVVKPAAPVAPGAEVEVEGEGGWVSRAAGKLDAALDAFGIPVAGRVALDVGASTGGFSQVLLERGAAFVLAIDVGHGQLSPALDPEIRAGRLVSLEGVNARDLVPGSFDAQLAGRAIELVVADLSFIPLRLVLPALVAVAPEAELVVLVKPQFEVGRGGVREGVVRSAALRADAIGGVLWAAHDLGLGVLGLESSTVVGTHGNSEYLAHLRAGAGSDPSEWSGRIAELSGG